VRNREHRGVAAMLFGDGAMQPQAATVDPFMALE
jgi:hypothetical protein